VKIDVSSCRLHSITYALSFELNGFPIKLRRDAMPCCICPFNGTEGLNPCTGISYGLLVSQLAQLFNGVCWLRNDFGGQHVELRIEACLAPSTDRITFDDHCNHYFP